MEIKNIGEGLVRLTPSVKGNKIQDIYTGYKYSEVECGKKMISRFSEIQMNA